MLRYISVSILVFVLASIFSAPLQAAETPYDLTVRSIEGGEVPLARYQGKVLLVVNTASQCGFTPQYEGLQTLYERYGEKGLVVLGFPSNDFGGQEPGSNEEIAGFCSSKFDVEFPLFEKGSVSGGGKQPLFDYLTANSPEPGEIKWNFEKFLVGRDGEVITRFRSRVEPLSDELVSEVEKALG